MSGNSRARMKWLGAAALAALLMAGASAPAAAQAAGAIDTGAGALGGDGGAAGSLQGLAGATAGGVPQARADQAVYDFGSVLNAVPVKHTFRIRNLGTGTLMIGTVQTSCGCTAAKPTRTEVPPGEASEIAVSFDTRFDKGPTSRTITVSTNDPKASKIVLTMKGDVKVQVEAVPAQVAFGDVRHGSAQSRVILLNDLVAAGAAGGKGGPLRIESLSNQSPNIKVERSARSDGKPGAALKVSLLGTMPLGPFDDTIKVATSRAPVDITVFGTVQGDLTVKPAQVSFGVVPRNQGTLRMARLVNAGPRAVRVTGVSSSNTNVSATIEPITPGKEYRLSLRLRPDTPDGALRGQVAITTDDPNQRTVSLPFYGIVGSFRG